MKSLMTVLVFAMIASTASAQQNLTQEEIQKRKQRFREKKQAQQQALTPKQRQQQQKRNLDLDSEPSAEPTEKMTVAELLLERKDMIGKVIELEFDKVIDLKQAGEGYSCRVTYESVRAVEGVTLMIPKEGLDYFEPHAEFQGRSKRGEILIEMLPGGTTAKALGIRYRKSEPEGDRYRW